MFDLTVRDHIGAIVALKLEHGLVHQWRLFIQLACRKRLCYRQLLEPFIILIILMGLRGAVFIVLDFLLGVNRVPLRILFFLVNFKDFDNAGVQRNAGVLIGLNSAGVQRISCLFLCHYTQKDVPIFNILL